jgi:hypothetical protein
MQDIDGFGRNGDSLHPYRKRLRKAGRQIVKNFMAQLGQAFGQEVVKVVARTRREFPLPAAGTIPETGTI